MKVKSCSFVLGFFFLPDGQTVCIAMLGFSFSVPSSVPTTLSLHLWTLYDFTRKLSTSMPVSFDESNLVHFKKQIVFISALATTWWWRWQLSDLTLPGNDGLDWEKQPRILKRFKPNIKRSSRQYSCYVNQPNQPGGSAEHSQLDTLTKGWIQLNSQATTRD